MYFMFKSCVTNVGNTLTLFPMLNPSNMVVMMYSPGLKLIAKLAAPFESVFLVYNTPFMLKVTFEYLA